MFKVVAILTSISMLTDFESVSKFTDQKNYWRKNRDSFISIVANEILTWNFHQKNPWQLKTTFSIFRRTRKILSFDLKHKRQSLDLVESVTKGLQFSRSIFGVNIKLTWGKECRSLLSCMLYIQKTSLANG